MLRSSLRLACVAAILTLGVGNAAAQLQPSQFGLFGDTAGTLTAIAANPGIAFDIHVVAGDLDGDLFGYEFSVSNPAGPFVLSRTTNPPSALDVGPGDDNYIVGTGICLPGTGPVVLLTQNVLLFAPQDDAVFCVGIATPTSFSPPTPGYLRCDESLAVLQAARVDDAGLVADGCLVVNCAALCPVANDEQSWGATKARFDH